MTERSAINAVTRGVVIAVISGTATALIAIAAWLSPGGRLPAIPMLRPENLLDSVLLFGLGYGLHRRSRVCAVLLLAYVAANAIGLSIALGRLSWIQLIFIYFYAQAARAIFALRKLDAGAAELAGNAQGR